MQRDKRYDIVECDRCHRPSLSNSSQQSRKCPYCGRRIRIENARILGSAATASAARELLQKIKSKDCAYRFSGG